MTNFSSEALLQIENISSKFQINPDLLIQKLNDYFFEEQEPNPFENIKTRADRRKRLKKLIKLQSDIHLLLSSGNEGTDTSFQLSFFFAGPGHREIFNKYQECSREFLNATQKVLAKMKRTRGTKKDTSYESAISTLLFIYKECTGKNPNNSWNDDGYHGYGDGFEFVKEMLVAIGLIDKKFNFTIMDRTLYEKIMDASKLVRDLQL